MCRAEPVEFVENSAGILAGNGIFDLIEHFVTGGLQLSIGTASQFQRSLPYTECTCSKKQIIIRKKETFSIETATAPNFIFLLYNALILRVAGV
jgi:hypothetical protein